MSEGAGQERLLIVLPAYNAARTLEATLGDIPATLKAELLLVDDASSDETVALARRLGLEVLVHAQNRGYGANQKTCYRAALERGVTYVAMLHPDRQYDGGRLPAMLEILQRGEAELVLGSRFLSRDPRHDGMPSWRYWGNRGLTWVQNGVYGQALSEYHTGLRAYRADALARLPLEACSDDFLFDQELLAYALLEGMRIREVETSCRYEQSSLSISWVGSIRYGLGSLKVLGQYLGKKMIWQDRKEG